MRLPFFSPTNPACWLASAGLAEATGRRVRWVSGVRGGIETETAVTADDLSLAAARCARSLEALSSDGEVCPRRWRAAARSEIDLQSWCAALATEVGAEIKSSQWRLVSGRQRWIQCLIDAAQSVTRENAAAWLTTDRWPLNEGWTMLGLDPSAYRPAAYTGGSRAWSAGHPVTLWLCAEAMRVLPSVPVSGRDPDAPHTLGWMSPREIRWPIWRHYASSDLIRSYVCKWLRAPDDLITVGECLGQVPARELLRAQGVDEIFSAALATEGYYYRLQFGQPI